MKKGQEKPKQLGSRVYKKHRTMIKQMKRWAGKNVSGADIVRLSIEEKFDRERVLQVVN